MQLTRESVRDRQKDSCANPLSVIRSFVKIQKITRRQSFIIPYVKDLEEEMLSKINQLGIGPGGLGGTTTALAVNINTYPTHIAGLPVAVNICCHVNRHVVRTL